MEWDTHHHRNMQLCLYVLPSPPGSVRIMNISLSLQYQLDIISPPTPNRGRTVINACFDRQACQIAIATRRRKALTLGRRRGKIQAAWVGIGPRACVHARQSSDRWSITLQPPLHRIIHSSTSTDVSPSLQGGLPFGLSKTSMYVMRELNLTIRTFSAQQTAIWCGNLGMV